jgi:short-chain Z-isoprenyl diphosphate synthase
MILDGNRRFARRQGLEDVSDGHRFGADKVSEVVRWCNELRIPVVTLWGLSTDNLGRDPEEVSRLLEIVGNRLDILSRDSDDVVQRRVRVMGRLEMLPDELRQQIQQAEELNAGPPRESEFLLNVAVAYGGRDEILDAFRQMLRAKGSSGESAFAIADGLSNDDLTPYLYAPDVPEPDLIIRTSGEVRLSGFLMWQSVYSELYFCDAPWPAFRKIDFLRAIRSFQARRRRFGQ